MLFLADSLLDAATEGTTYNYWAEFVNMLITLFVIVALIIVSVWVLKRVMRSRFKQLNDSTAIKVLERRALNPKASIYLVDILGKGVVIAESQSGISLIKEFSEDDNVGLLMDQLHEKIPSKPPVYEKIAAKLKTAVARRA